MRSVLLAPKVGFEEAIGDLERKGREGRTPYVLAFVGGASLFMLWLKVGALMGIREVCDPPRLALYLFATGALGGLLMLFGQALWGAVGPRAARALHSDGATAAGSRYVFGLAAAPLVVALLVLLPLDLLIVGTETFTTDRLSDPLATAWAAFSIAAWMSAAVWGLYLLLRGFQAQTGLSAGRALLGAAAACACLGLFVAALVLGASFVQGAACPT